MKKSKYICLLVVLCCMLQSCAPQVPPASSGPTSMAAPSSVVQSSRLEEDEDEIMLVTEMTIRPHLEGDIGLEGAALLEAQAILLADHLVHYALVDFVAPGETVSVEEIFWFVCVLQYYYDELLHPYRYAITEVEWPDDGCYYLDQELCAIAVWELFGVEDYRVFEEYPAMEFEGRTVHRFNWGVGPPWGFYDIIDPYVRNGSKPMEIEPVAHYDPEANTVEVVFELYDNAFIVDADEQYGTYHMVFTVLEGDGRHFLRLYAFESV